MSPMIFRRILTAVVASVALLAGGLAVTASPAMADVPANCANSSLCSYGAALWRTSEGYEWNPSSPGQECEAIGLTNQWTSVYNNSGRTVRMYKGAGCTGGYWSLAGGGELRNMGFYQPAWNDEIESIRFM